MITHKEKKLALFEQLKKKILSWLHLTNDPVIKLYQGYGNLETVIVFGHVLCLSSLPRKKYKKNFINNTYGLLRLFMVKRYVNVSLSLQWDGITHETKKQDDGFFNLDGSCALSFDPGWHHIK